MNFGSHRGKPFVCSCRGLLGTVGTVAKEEGAKALWAGIEPGHNSINTSNFFFVHSPGPSSAHIHLRRSTQTSTVWWAKNWTIRACQALLHGQTAGRSGSIASQNCSWHDDWCPCNLYRKPYRLGQGTAYQPINLQSYIMLDIKRHLLCMLTIRRHWRD